MKVVLTGANGQLGRCFRDKLPSNWQLITADHNQLDIADLTVVDNFIATYKPDAIVNAAAYTAVDKAESEPLLAQQVNELAVGNLAIAAQKYSAKLIHISTDYVFDGTSSKPYLETDTTSPINVYGASKRDGEVAVLKNSPDAIIIRTAWVFSEYGNNFVKTMLKLAATRTELSVITDQMGCPTYAGDIATAIVSLLKQNALGGIYNYCGITPVSWHEFAVTIFDIATRCQRIQNAPIVKKILSAEYPTQAQRPHYSVLNLDKISKLGISGSDWKAALKVIIPDISLSN